MPASVPACSAQLFAVTWNNGVAIVGMNAWWVADEMDYALNDSKPKVLIADDRRLEAFAQIQEKHPDIKVVSVREPNSPVAAKASRRRSSAINTFGFESLRA